ncbi:MAG: YkgJ family cysteine cluster protein [Acidobacteriota bacterium]|nr:YkgJ family cysteine cluster protein [Acidobacteriota bacterium]MDH3525285.1 YkgJ family cysteine cluster protein [Acidobacteriota bacterium]
MSDRSSPWYAEGLRFGCTRCGACCRGEGHVWVDAAEAGRLAENLGLELGDFGRRYLRLVGNRLALTDAPGPDRACVFWDGGCRVYPARPTQCRTFPFWRDLLSDEDAWREAAELSPGINRGRRYALAEIERLLSGDGAAADAPELSEAS